MKPELITFQRGRSDAVAAGRGCVALTCGATTTAAPPSPSPAARTLPEGEVAALLARRRNTARFGQSASPCFPCAPPIWRWERESEI